MQSCQHKIGYGCVGMLYALQQTRGSLPRLSGFPFTHYIRDNICRNKLLLKRAGLHISS